MMYNSLSKLHFPPTGTKHMDCDVLDFHQHIEELSSKLNEANKTISRLESQLCETRDSVQLDVAKKDEEMLRLRDRYDRLSEGHRQLHKQNQSLEEKLLSVVTKYEAEKAKTEKELAHSNRSLQELVKILSDLEEENRKCRNDCSLAVHLLQHKPSNYVSHRLGSLPTDLKFSLQEHMQLYNTLKTNQSSSSLTTSVSKDSLLNSSSSQIDGNVDTRYSPNSSQKNYNMPPMAPQVPPRMPIMTFPPMGAMFPTASCPPVATNQSEDLQQANKTSYPDLAGDKNRNIRNQGYSDDDDVKVCNKMLAKVLKERIFCDVTRYQQPDYIDANTENFISVNFDRSGTSSPISVTVKRLVQLEFLCSRCDSKELRPLAVESTTQTTRDSLDETVATSTSSSSLPRQGSRGMEKTRNNSRSLSCDCEACFSNPEKSSSCDYTSEACSHNKLVYSSSPQLLNINKIKNEKDSSFGYSSVTNRTRVGAVFDV